MKSSYKKDFVLKHLLIISDVILNEIEERSLICSPKLSSQFVSKANLTNSDPLIKAANWRRRGEFLENRVNFY